jgi:hypothetical protein
MKVNPFLLPWLLSFTAIQCAPTGDDAPGIGVELEVRAFVLENKGEAAMNTRSDADLAKAKGATLLSVDYQNNGKYLWGGITCGQFWDLTAEHSGSEAETGLSKLTFEWIIDGTSLKLKKSNNAEDDLVLPGVFKELREQTVTTSHP